MNFIILVGSTAFLHSTRDSEPCFVLALAVPPAPKRNYRLFPLSAGSKAPRRQMVLRPNAANQEPGSIQRTFKATSESGDWRLGGGIIGLLRRRKSGVVVEKRSIAAPLHLPPPPLCCKLHVCSFYVCSLGFKTSACRVTCRVPTQRRLGDVAAVFHASLIWMNE